MGGDHIPFKIPDWKTYKVGDHTPELQKLERMLASHGLKDPWIRNEVWRYDRRTVPYFTQSITRIFKRGFVPGLTLALIASAYHYYQKSKDHHGHGHEHNENHH